MAFCPDYKSSLSHFDLARYNSKIEFCGVDPYELTANECSDSLELWPKIFEVDRLDYFVYQKNFVSKESMKCLKSLKAHNFFTSGFVEHPFVKDVNAEMVIVLGKVRHSQALTLPSLKSRLLVKKNGEIVTGHCTCMAGRGEACSHLAAVVFTMEYAAKATADVACTDQLNAWLPPSMGKTVPKRTIAEMDFSSPAARIVRKKILGTEEIAKAPQWLRNVQENNVQLKDAVNDFFATLAETDPKLIVMSTLSGEKPDHFIPSEISDELPKLMSSLYDEHAEDLPYEDLLNRCKIAMQDVSTTSADSVKKAEEFTRDQAASDLWFKFREGRITASKMKSVCSGSIDNPAKSTINSICYGGKDLESLDVERGKRLGNTAVKKYEYLLTRNHEDFSVKKCGLFICKDMAYLADSPDGIVSCSCCEGKGGLEIKCPISENMHSSFDGNGNLRRNRSYFYQVQTQMYVCDLSYCDFFVYNVKSHILHRVLPDKSCHEEIVIKSKQYFMYVILAELIAKHFSLNRPPLPPNLVNPDGETENICYCQTPRRRSHDNLCWTKLHIQRISL